RQIDELEDYDPNRAVSDNEYERVEIEVFDLARNSIGKAWTYQMDRQRVQALSGHWLPQGLWTGELANL
ncbi:MAG: gamma-glutamylcyclotransferase, partial [Microcoleus sp. SIO2G3]|nr:gamma-glutamylcyclotransferase [Microcoleus sp. SIO2G3]